MKKILQILIIMLGWQVALFAQSVPMYPKEVKVGKPSILKPTHGIYKKSDLMREFSPGNKWGTESTVKEFWTVYSDRNRNQLYADASLTKKLPVMLVLGQPVVIADVKGDAALVYEDSKLECYPIIPSYAKRLGWIPMENLLLWDKCLADQRGVQYKVLIAMSLNKMGGKDFKRKCYETPTDMGEPKDFLMDGVFCFIAKESSDGNRVLLCRNPSISGNNIYGWVDRKFFFIWDQRVCIEPNWDPQFVETHRGQKVGIHGDEQLTADNKVISWEFGRTNGDKDSNYIYRMVPEQLRLPVVEFMSGNNDRIYCTSFIDQSGGLEVDSMFIERFLGKRGYHEWQKVKAISTFDGYTPDKDSNGDPYWNYVLFLSDDELRRLLDDLKSVYQATKTQLNDRKPYIDAMTAVVRSCLGQNNDKKIDLLDMNEIHEIIYGLNVYSQLTHSWRLKDIMRSNVVMDSEYQDLISAFKEKYEKLQSVLNDCYYYRMKIGRNYYYWIPLEDLP